MCRYLRLGFRFGFRVKKSQYSLWVQTCSAAANRSPEGLPHPANQELQPGNFRHHPSQRANYSKPVFSGVREAREFPRAEGDRDKAGKRRSHCLTFLQRLRVMYPRRCWIQGLCPSCQFNSRIKSQVLPLVPLELSCVCTEQHSRP